MISLLLEDGLNTEKREKSVTTGGPKASSRQWESGSELSSRSGDLQAVKDALQDRNPVLHQALALFLESADVTTLSLVLAQSSLAPVPNRQTIRSFGASGRRGSMHVPSRPLLDSDRVIETSKWVADSALVPPSISLFPSKTISKAKASLTSAGLDDQGSLINLPVSGLTLSALEAAHRSQQQKRGGGLGPPTMLGCLAMDFLEDWVGGRCFPEALLSANSEVAGGGGMTGGATVRTLAPLVSGDKRRDDGGGGARRREEKEGDNEGYGGDSATRPSTWVEDVGTGKEWDKLVGYWRFSDCVKSGEYFLYPPLLREF